MKRLIYVGLGMVGVVSAIPASWAFLVLAPFAVTGIGMTAVCAMIFLRMKLRPRRPSRPNLILIKSEQSQSSQVARERKSA